MGARSRRLACVALAAATLLAGCGQKGPLFLPAPAAAAPASAPAQPASAASAA